MKNIFGSGKLSSKGLAIAVCTGLVIVVGSGVYSYTKLTDELNSKLISDNNIKSANDISDSENNKSVDAEQTGIARTTTETTTVASETETPVEDVNIPADGLSVEADVDSSIDAGINSSIDANKKTNASKDENTQAQAMVRPINGEVINIFSDGELVKSKTLNVWKTHDGVDISGELGEKVKSMTGGTVIKVYDDPLLGATVIIDHNNGLEGYYSNLNKDISIAEGDKVSAGTIIGYIGDTAESEIGEVSHLHFSVKKNGEWIDPIALISGEGS